MNKLLLSLMLTTCISGRLSFCADHNNIPSACPISKKIRGKAEKCDLRPLEQKALDSRSMLQKYRGRLGISGGLLAGLGLAAVYTMHQEKPTK